MKTAMTTVDKAKAEFLVDALDSGEGIPAKVVRSGSRYKVIVPDRIDSQVLRAAIKNFNEDWGFFFK